MKDETTLKIEYLEREISELKRLTNRSERPVSMVSRKSWKKRLPVLLAAVSILSAVGLATAADIPHTFGTGGVISATKFNENFTYIVDRLWDKDGTNLYYNDGGDVGIGTASPDRELHVKQSASTSGNGIRIENSTGSKNLKFYVDTTGAVIDAFSGADLLLRTESSDRLTILNAGNVGIGTTGPGSKLEIKGSGSTNATAGLNVTNSAGTSGLYVRDDGNVGIGTTEPNAKFAVQQTGGEDAIIVQDSAQPTTTQLQLATDSIDMQRADGSNVDLDIRTTLSSGSFGSGGDINFSPNNSTVVTIKKDGNVGIGEETPGATLDIKGTVKIFGTWVDVSWTSGTAYQAASDGFVVATISTDDNYDSGYIVGYTDSSSNPTTARTGASVNRADGAVDVKYNSFTLPVKKDDYWKVVLTNGSQACVVDVDWIPLGHN